MKKITTIFIIATFILLNQIGCSKSPTSSTTKTTPQYLRDAIWQKVSETQNDGVTLKLPNDCELSKTIVFDSLYAVFRQDLTKCTNQTQSSAYINYVINASGQCIFSVNNSGTPINDTYNIVKVNDLELKLHTVKMGSTTNLVTFKNVK